MSRPAEADAHSGPGHWVGALLDFNRCGGRLPEDKRQGRLTVEVPRVFPVHENRERRGAELSGVRASAQLTGF